MNNNWFLYPLLAALVFTASLVGRSLYAQEAQASLGREEIKIGEQVMLDLMLTAPEGASVEWPAFDDTLTANIEVMEVSGIDTLTGSLHQQVLLTSFDSGHHVIPPITFQVNGQSVQTGPNLLSVNTVPLDSANAIADIKTVMTVKVSYWELFKEWLGRNWPWVVGVGVTMILLIIGLIIFLNRKKAPPAPKTVVIRPAHEIALEKLTLLNTKQLWQNNQPKLYYSELTEILREYLENRYRINALELTTDEILANLKAADISRDVNEALTQLLRLSDLVKFAKHQPQPHENDRFFEEAVQFVEQTREALAEKQSETVDQA